MVKTLFTALALFSFIQDGFAQTTTYAYTDSRMLWSEIICHVEGGIVREGGDWRGEITHTVSGNKIFSGFSSSNFDLAYTFRDGKLYIGDSYFTDAIAYTLHENKIYVGDSTFPLDLAYTIENNSHKTGVLSVYRDSSMSPFDIVAYLQGAPNECELFSILISMSLL
jgi:hypothetical protein